LVDRSFKDRTAPGICKAPYVAIERAEAKAAEVGQATGALVHSIIAAYTVLLALLQRLARYRV
jgi:hypothetical protein